ncbi:SusC/RagA family TonB-linked outer membrane protein [Chitinophaga caseinilytica]|uniref:SusC/RagA family TonB-linked outer membrane protein n=1 Tax=Chitinophaga caseinilytica TaxID=2267521 RepID=A0ABZ2YWL4_9BACT
MTKKLLFLLVLLGAAYAVALAQDRKVSGTVTDAKGEALPGVSIREVGTSNGTASLADGKFTLTLKSASPSLEFSFMGYTRTTIKVEGRTDFKVVMQSDAQQLKDVVITGYEQKKRKTLTTAVTRLEGDEIQNIPAASVVNLLQGRIAGLGVINNSGAPGIGAPVFIRGNASVASSFNDNRIYSDPLYVVDGIQVPADRAGSKSFSSNDFATGNSPISWLNPNDIESIDVLKDAAAAAVYGSRGANGVIIIKTRTAKTGKPKIDLRAYNGVNFAPQLFPMLGGKAEREAKVDIWQRFAPYDQLMSGMPIQMTDSLNPYFNNSTDWQSMYFRTGRIQNYDASVSSGNEMGNFRLGGGYYDEQGIVLNTGFKRYSASFTGRLLPNKKTTIQLQSYLGRTDRSRGNSRNGQGISSRGIWSVPSSVYMVPDKSPYGGGMLDAYTRNRDKNFTNTINTSLQVMYQFTPELLFTSTGSISYAVDKRDYFFAGVANNGISEAGQYNGASNAYTITNQLSYSHTTPNNDHNYGAFVVQEFNKNTMESTIIQGTGGGSDYVQIVNGYSRKNTFTQTGYGANATSSVLGKVNYGFREKYLFDASLRADGSSKLSPDRRWGYFPTFSVGWRITEEPFVKNNLPWIDEAKVRYSWGKTANQFVQDYGSISSLLPIGGGFGEPQENYVSTYGGTPVAVQNFSQMQNRDLDWEYSDQSNLGIEIAVLKNRISLIADFYQRYTEGGTYAETLPTSSGYSMINRNGVDLLNKGFELTLSGKVFNSTKPGGFNWTTRVTLARNTTKVAKLPNNNQPWYLDQLTMVKVGSAPYGYLFMVNDGVWQSDAEVPVDPFTGKKLYFDYGYLPYRVGSPRFLDLNGDYKINDLNGDGGREVNDRMWVGDPSIKLEGGWTNTFSYKNFTVDMMFNYRIGVKVVNSALQRYWNSTKVVGGYNPNYKSFDYFNGNSLDWGGIPPLGEYDIFGFAPGSRGAEDARFPTLNYWTGSVQTFWNIYDYKSAFVEDASFMRLKNLMVSYNVPSKTIRRIGLDRALVYANTENVFILTKYSGRDPEGIEFPSGYDRGRNYPLSRKITLGLNLTF